MSKVEKAVVLICVSCTVGYGENQCVYSCSECGEPFQENQEIICAKTIGKAGEHYCSKECEKK